MSKTFLVTILCFVMLANLFSLTALGQSAKISYPKAEQIEQIDEYNGVRVRDPFRWLEDLKGEKTASWIKAQDQLLQGFLHDVPARKTIHNRISALLKFDRYSVPSRANGKYFFTRTDAASSAPVLYVQDSASAKPRVLMDVKAHFNNPDLSLGPSMPSPDGRWVLYAVSKGQSRWFDLRLIDVSTGVDQNRVEAISHTIGGTVSWTRDSKGFFYTRFEKPEGTNAQLATVGNGRIYYHRVGEPQDSEIFAGAQQANSLLSHLVTGDGRYLIVSVSDGGSTRNRVLYKDLSQTNGEMKSLIDVADANYTFLGNEGTRFWFYTNLNAPRGRIILIDVTKPERTHWVEVIKEAKETIAANSAVGGNAVGMFAGRFTVVYLEDGRPSIKVFTRDGRLQRRVSLPEGGMIWGGFAGDRDDPDIFYLFTGIRHPATVFRLNLTTGQSVVFHEPKLKFDRDQIVVTQGFYTSKDGTRVPISLAHKRGIQLDGNNPTYMYGYGAFGWVSFMWYQPRVIAWLEMGGVYALPAIRGGGEYGEEWHKAGMKLQEQNSVDDYIAAAEWLIRNKYTSPRRLVATGGSASGSLAAAAMIQRPDLFGAIVIDRPVLDLLRFDQFTAASYWRPEFGSPANPEEFKFLRGYSPYHNLKSGQCYPPTLVMIGDRDQTAVPLHAYKFTAAMQAAQGCDQPVLLKMMWGAGHNFGATPEQTTDSFTDELTFIYRVLGLDVRQNSPTETRSAKL